MQNRDRRSFIKAGALTGAGALLPGTAATSSAPSSAPSAEVKSYRRLGRTELQVSDISFGSSRLRTGQEHLVEHAMSAGINYIDTAESYTRGQSETVLGNSIKGKREQVYLVSKTLTNRGTSATTMMRDLEGSLRRLQTDYIDVYMNHAVNRVETVGNPEWQAFVEKAREQGKIRFTGISGHAGRLVECLDYAIDNNLVDVVLVGYNFGQDPAFYAGLTRGFDRIATLPDLPRVLSKAKQHDIGVVAMKTLMGARLNDMRPYENAGATFSQAAFSWTLSNPDVDALIVSMTGIDQIDEYLGASGKHFVSSASKALLDQYAYLNGANYCRHACNLCEGACPHEVPIADVLRTRMYATDYQDIAFARSEYALLTSDASACLGCSGAPCQNACPNGIEIDKLCAPTHRMLGLLPGESLA